MKISYNKVFAMILFIVSSQTRAMIEPYRLQHKSNNHSGSTVEESRTDFKSDNSRINV